MSFEIRVNGEKFTFWESASLRRAIKNNTGVFVFSSTTKDPVDFPVKAGDNVQIIINGVTRLTGHVRTLSARGSKERGNVVTVMGRDNVQDVIDSSVPDAVKSIATPISMKGMCEKVIAALGLEIKVIDTVGNIPDFTGEILADSGKKCMDFLVEFARKKQVYLVADGLGNLVIYRPLGKKSDTTIIHEKNGTANNIKNYSFTDDEGSMFHTYAVKSQDNFGGDPFADYSDGGINRTGESIDNNIRDTRYIEVQAEESMPNDEAGKRADEINNIQRSNGFNYTVTFVGLAQNNGDIWDFGLTVPVRDSVVGVNGSYLLQAVEFNSSVDEGTTASLSFTLPDAFKVIGTQTQQDKRAAPKPEQYKKDTGTRNSVVFLRKERGIGLE